MLDHLSAWHLLVLAVVGLILFGPTRLPAAVRDAARVFRQLRATLHAAAADVRAELGPEMAGLTLTDLHLRRVVSSLAEGSPADNAAAALAPAAATADSEGPPPYDVDAT